MSDNCDNLPPDYPGYSGIPGFPNPYPPGSPGNPAGGGTGGPGGGTGGGGTGGGTGGNSYSGAPGFDGLPRKTSVELDQLKSFGAEQDFRQSYTQNTANEYRLLQETKELFLKKSEKQKLANL